MKRRVKSFLLAILMVFTILPTNFVTVEAENCDIKIMVDSDKGEELLDSKFTIKANQYQKIRIYFWMEGQDPDCINEASLGGGLTLDIGFSKPGTQV